MRCSPGIAAIPILALTLGACNDAGAPPLAAAAVDTVDGVERYLYSDDGAGTLPWALDTVTVIGDAFADDPYQFNQVSASGLAGGPDGSLLVLDRQGNRILHYDGEGAHLGTYGREGEGPGELSQPLGLALGPGDTIWVSDFSNSRLTGFPSDGGDPRMVSFPENAGFPAGQFATVGDGVLMEFRPMFNFQRGSGGGFRMSRGEGSEAERPEIPLVRYDREKLAPIDTLWTVPEPPSDMVQLDMGGALMVTMMSREFYPELLWAAFPDGGVVVSDTTAYLLHLLAPDGSEMRRIARAPEPRAVTEADREAARERVREASRSSGGIRIGGAAPDEEAREKMLQQRLEKMTFADVVPRIVDLRVDPAGRIWVAVSEDVADEMARIDVYDRDGTLLGELRDFPLPDVFLGADRIGLLQRDELDVQQVVVLQLREGAASAGD
jgi:hypothetical protein